MLELAASPSRVSWFVAIGWFLVLVFVGEAARYISYLERRRLHPEGVAPVGAPVNPPGEVSFALAAAVPLVLAPMMMLRPPGEVTVWLAGSALLWAGSWVMVGLVHVGSALHHELGDEAIDLTDLVADPVVIDLRERRPQSANVPV